MTRATLGKPTAAVMLGDRVAGFIPVTRTNWNGVVWTPEMDAELRRLRLIGYSVEHIAERIGVAAEVARNRLRERGLAVPRAVR